MPEQLKAHILNSYKITDAQKDLSRAMEQRLADLDSKFNSLDTESSAKFKPMKMAKFNKVRKLQMVKDNTA